MTHVGGCTQTLEQWIGHNGLTTNSIFMWLQIEVSLGPLEELLQGDSFADGAGGLQDTARVTVDKGGVADVLLKGAVQVHPDRLSCGQMLLAAARTFASQKIMVLASDLDEVAQELGCVSLPFVSVGQVSCAVAQYVRRTDLTLTDSTLAQLVYARRRHRLTGEGCVQMARPSILCGMMIMDIMQSSMPFLVCDMSDFHVCGLMCSCSVQGAHYSCCSGRRYCCLHLSVG